MSLTWNTVPNEIDNTAVWNISTGITEDSSHVNVRVETTVYVDGVAVAKKSKPKSVTDHDYTDIIRSLVKWSTPTPFDETSGYALKDPGAGSQLLTSFTNDGTNPYEYFNASGNQIIGMLNSSGSGMATSNAITLDKTKTYVCLLKAGSMTIAGAQNVVFRFWDGAAYNSTYVYLSAGNTKRKFFLQPKFDGTGYLHITCASPATCEWSGVTVELYALNTTDWWKGYWITAQEKYEDASGITQSGTLVSQVYYRAFVDAPGLTQTEFQAMFLSGSSGTPLMAPNYDSSTPDISVSSTHSFVVYSGKPASSIARHWAVLLPTVDTPQIRYSYITKNTSGVTQTSGNSSYVNCLHPIMILGIDDASIKYMTTVYPYGTVQIQNSGGSQISKDLYVLNDSRSFQEIIPLVWRNDYGGWSTKVFPNDILKTRRIDNKKTFRNDTGLKQSYASDRLENIQAKDRLIGTSARVQFLADMIDSPFVYYYRGATDPVPVFLNVDNLRYKDAELICPSIDFDFIP